MARIVGVDIGGTFTDLVLRDEITGQVGIAKVPSTPGDPSQALLDGLAVLGVSPDALSLIVHGTTVATNAVLERKGAAVGVIMTEGFRDVLELRRRDRPQTYGLRGTFTPLSPRRLRVEVLERTDYRGKVESTPTEESLKKAARTLLDRGAEVAVISFLNAYANPANEARAREVVESVWPNPYVVAASDVLPEIREFERTATAVLNGYVQPLVERYLENLMRRLREKGYDRDVLLIQSNGGVMSQAVARRFSVNTVLSGPAAGVAATERLGRAVGRPNLIACDVGGTSLDIAVIVDGAPATARDAALEYGLPIRVPMLDIRTAGAGGGSIAWIDRAGVLNIGPESAGADPGPVCYGQGGQAPTLTDANLVLGRINPGRPIGRESGFTLDRQGAATVIGEVIGKPLGLSPEDAAWSILRVANHKIAAAIRMLTVERGLDPRDFTMVAYGGGGPLHAGALLDELELGAVLIPPWPGIFSALGCLTADVRHDFVLSLNRRLDDLDPDHLYGLLDGHHTEGRRLIESEGAEVSGIEARFEADMAYDGQIHEVRTVLPPPPADRAGIRAAFEAAYRAQYGDVVGERPVRVVTLRTAVIGVRPAMALPGFQAREGAAPGDTEPTAREDSSPPSTRSMHCEKGWMDTPVVQRDDLEPGMELTGPVLIEQPDTTTVVEPGQKIGVDEGDNLVLERA